MPRTDLSLLCRTKPTSGLSISNPKSITDSEGTESSLPPYSPQKTHDTLTEFESDARSEVTTHYGSPPSGECKAIGSYTDLTLRTPTTIASFTPGFLCNDIPEVEKPESTFASLTAFSHPRLRALILPSSHPLPSSPPRPITFPSIDLSACNSHPFKHEP